MRSALVEDVRLQDGPALTPDDVDGVAETVADHLVGEFFFRRRDTE